LNVACFPPKPAPRGPGHAAASEYPILRVIAGRQRQRQGASTRCASRSSLPVNRPYADLGRRPRPFVPADRDPAPTRDKGFARPTVFFSTRLGRTRVVDRIGRYRRTHRHRHILLRVQWPQPQSENGFCALWDRGWDPGGGLACGEAQVGKARRLLPIPPTQRHVEGSPCSPMGSRAQGV